LRWNAVHYQDIAGVPASVTDPKVYWDTLETKRRQWNQAQGIDPNAHMVYYKFLKPFESIILHQNPELGPIGAKQKAEEVLYEWWAQEQQRIEQEDADKPVEKQRNADEIERRANEALARRLQQYIKDQFNPKTDEESVAEQPSLFAATQTAKWQVEAAGEQYNLMTGEAAGKYGAFMGTHLKAISQISQHADEIARRLRFRTYRSTTVQGITSERQHSARSLRRRSEGMFVRVALASADDQSASHHRHAHDGRAGSRLREGDEQP
jgi:hypothetical protein